MNLVCFSVTKIKYQRANIDMCDTQSDMLPNSCSAIYFFLLFIFVSGMEEREVKEKRTQKKTRTNEITEKELKNYCYLIQLLFDIEFINCLADFIIYGFSSGWFRSKEEKKKQE